MLSVFMLLTAANQWTSHYTTAAGIMYPAEAVIRIFRGNYRELRLPKPKPGDSILDVGCGDGRHFGLFREHGLKIAGVDIADMRQLDLIFNHRKVLGVWWPRFRKNRIELHCTSCAVLPWPDASFDYALAWNSIYYMNTSTTFDYHAAQVARVLKPGGWLICSVPKKTHEIFDGAKFGDDGYVTIVGDRFGLRNGERFRWFDDADCLEGAFRSHFDSFCHASIHDDMFDHPYHWHVIVAQRT